MTDIRESFVSFFFFFFVVLVSFYFSCFQRSFVLPYDSRYDWLSDESIALMIGHTKCANAGLFCGFRVELGLGILMRVYTFFSRGIKPLTHLPVTTFKDSFAESRVEIAAKTELL